MDRAIFAAGCFWGVEATFRALDGVISTEVGYTGGQKESPTYHEVCTDMTGHAEALRVEYDPSKISYEELVKIFFECHDPTTVNRQGPDIGSQYRSGIFYLDESQKAIARRIKEELDSKKRFRRPIVTEITKASTFYRAEDYHQQYLEKRGLANCHVSLKH